MMTIRASITAAKDRLGLCHRHDGKQKSPQEDPQTESALKVSHDQSRTPVIRWVFSHLARPPDEVDSHSLH